MPLGREFEMRSLALLVAGLALCQSAISAAARDKPREVQRLAPSSQWRVEYADEACRLTREFGEGNRNVLLVMDQFEPSDDYRFTFISKMMVPVQHKPAVKGQIRFGPNEGKNPFTGVPGKVGSENAVFVDSDKRLATLTPEEKAAFELAANKGQVFKVGPISDERKRAASYLEISDLLKFDLILDTGSMEEPLRVLDHCAWDLVRSWGFDVQQQKNLTRGPHVEGSIRWIGPDDYPSGLVASGTLANVRVRVLVDAQGRPTSCTVQRVTEPKIFGKIVCKNAMQRARFIPALDAKGVPVPSYFSNSVNFRIAS